MDTLKSLSGKLFWGKYCLSEEAICDFRKAVLEAVSDGQGECEDFHVEDEGEAGYRCDMIPPDQRDSCGAMLETRLNNEGVMALVLATRKLHITADMGLDAVHVDDWSEKNALDANRSVIFSMLEPAT